MNQDYSANTFQTFDLALAASLYALGFTNLTLDRSNPSRVAFIFEREPKLDEVIQRYWADDIKLSPKTYFDILKHLKSRIYSR